MNGVANGASATAPAGGSSTGGEESDELEQLSTLPPPSASDDVPLSLFNPDASKPGASDEAEDFLIDEVFSSL